MTAPGWLADDDAVRAVRDRIQALNEQDYPVCIATLAEDNLSDGDPGLRLVPAPGSPRWTPEEIRDFLAENVTVVGPGETLVIRAWPEFTPNQVREIQEVLNFASDFDSLPFRCLVVPGAELGKVAVPVDEVAALVGDGKMSVNAGRKLLGLEPFADDAVPS